MSPINDGEVGYVVRNLVRQAQEGIDTMVRDTLAAARKADDRRRTITDIAFREFHAEAFGNWKGHSLPTYAQHTMARVVFEVPTLTETPVDRWMEKFRGRAGYHSTATA